MRSFQPLQAISAAALSLVFAISPDGAALGASAPPPTYALTAWAAEKGLPPGDVFAITQDLEGYLWLGTPTGLQRFDGARFARFEPADPRTPLPSGPVHALVVSSDGDLWVGFGGGGAVVRIHDGAIVRYSPADGAPPGVSAMIQDRHGTIWVAARRGVFRFSNGRWSTVGETEGYSGAEAFTVYEDRAGNLWVGSASGVYRRTKDAFALVDAGSNNVQSLTEDESGAIWVTDSLAIVKKLSTHASPQPVSGIRLPTGGWRVLRDGHGQLWVAAFGGGLLRVTDPADPSASIERFDYEHRLAGSPRSLYEDREGNLWVGMRGGLLRLSQTSFSNVPSLEGLTNDGVRTAAVGPDGSVWVATGHGLNHFAGASRTAYALSQTMALHTDQHGELWIAGSQQIGRLRNGRLESIPIPDAIRTSRVMSLTTDARDTLWLCTALKGVMAWDGKNVLPFEDRTDISNKACQSIYTDSLGRVWIGLTAGGAAVYDNGTFTKIGVDDGLPPGTVLGILEGRNGAVWLSTTGGVSRYRNGQLTSMTLANAPLVDLVPVLVDDEEDYIWVGVNSGAGVIRFHPDEVDKVALNPKHHLEYAFYDESDGMQQGSQTWQSGVGGVRGGDGRLWVATGLGMTVIDPRRLPTARRPASPGIEAVTADGRRIVPQRGMSLPARTSTLRIEYGTVSLSSASKLRFRYMLEGIDDDWVYAGDVRNVTYNNVPSGSHRFRVSTTHDGRWTEAALWDFSVAPPVYRTRTFLVLGASGMALLVGATWWLRLRAVRSQYSMVFAERARVSREIHDTLLQSLAAIGVELETIATQLDSSQGPAREELRRLRRQVGHCLREARESILELRHNTIKPRALIDSLRELAEKTTGKAGVKTQLSTTGRPHHSSADVDLQLLRISQEAARNAVRHGHARHIRIALAYGQDQVVLTVSDDGCGFTVDDSDPAPAVGEHLGLLTMRERAARIRGRLAILSSPGRGTTIEATVPLEVE